MKNIRKSPITRKTSAMCGSGIPMSQLFDPYERILLQIFVTESRAVMRIVLGMYKSSVKKIRVLKIKKIVRNGANIKLPTSDMSEIGIPHAARIGSEVAVAII